MRVLILGASGQIGNVLLQCFQKDPNIVAIGTSRKEHKDYFQFDPFQDHWTKLGQVDVIINTIGQIEASGASSFEKVHIGISKLIIENRPVLGNPKVLQISVLGADPESKIAFLQTKGIADQFLVKHSDCIVVRPSIVCTPGTMLVKKLLMLGKIATKLGKRMIVPKGFLDHKIQPVMVDDVARIAYNLCKLKEYQPIINITGPEKISYRTLLELALPGIRLIEIPKPLTEFFVKVIISPFLPALINSQQYDLLFSDNIADEKEAERYLRKPLASTLEFWKNELRQYASN